MAAVLVFSPGMEPVPVSATCGCSIASQTLYPLNCQWGGKESGLTVYLVWFLCMLHLEAVAFEVYFKCEVISFFKCS